MKKIFSFFAASVICAGLAACKAGDKDGSVRIVSVKPELTSLVRVGDKMDLAVTVEYDLKREKGNVSMVVQKQDTSSIGSAQAEITKGTGTVTLKHSFVVPETPTINVFTPIYLPGVKKTEVVDSRIFNVAPKKGK